MQKFWTLIFGASLALGAQAQTLINVDAIGECRKISDPYKRVVCYDEAVMTDVIVNPRNVPAPEAQPQPTPAPTAPIGTLQSWAGNMNLPAATRLAAQVLGSNERTMMGGYPIAIVDSDTHEMLTPPSSPLENFLNGMSDDAMAAAKYKRDYYFAIGNSPESTENAILSMACQKNITDFKIHFAKPFPKTEEEVIFTIADDNSENIQDQTHNERFVSDGYIMQMPRGLEGIRLIKWIAGGGELQVKTERNGEIVTLRFATREIDAPLSILARQCSWN